MRTTLIVLTVVACLITTGCESLKREYSQELQEQATVAQLGYTPTRHGSGAGPTMDINGNIGLAFTSVTIDEQHLVILACKHGKFQLRERDATKIWNYHTTGSDSAVIASYLKEGDPIIVLYREVYDAVYNQDGTLKSRTLSKLDFLNIRKKDDTTWMLTENAYDH